MIRQTIALFLTIAALSTLAVAAETKMPTVIPRPDWAIASTADSTVDAVSNDEAKEWLRWLIPLPKRVRFAGKFVLPASEIKFCPRRDATDVERTAVDELARLITKKTGVKEFGGQFRIHVGVCDAEGKIDGMLIPGACELSGLSNSNEAYVITPLPERGIAVAALTDRGVHHGLKTLEQLIEPKLTAGKITLPVVAVLDWPDLAERGQWGCWYATSVIRDIEHFADLKLNLVEVWSRLGFDAKGRPVAPINTARQEAARLHAVNWVPIINHLEQLQRTGVFKRYPEVRGKGPHAQLKTHPHVIAMCFSEPKAIDILATWFLSLATTKGVEDICVWLSENPVRCTCPKCKDKPQQVLEAEACVRAWQLARKKNPSIRLRILVSQGTYKFNDKILAVVSDHPEIGIIYYHGSLTYNSARKEMVYPLMADFAKQGRWLSCCPQYVGTWACLSPWSCPQFIKYRMTEFVNKGLKCTCGYVPSDNRFCDFNVTAVAEWSWNAHGRTEWEFAAAWATRRGLADPEKVADWAVMLGPVGWDIYGARIPRVWGGVPRIIEKRTQFKLGSGMFRYFPNVEHMDNDLAVCDKALELAKEINDPAIILESRIIRGYLRMTKSIYTIADAVAGKQELDDNATMAVQAVFDELVREGKDMVENLEAWKKVVIPDGKFFQTHVFTNSIDATRDVVSGVAKALAPLGIKDGQKDKN